MFQNLSERLSSVAQALRGKARLTEADVNDALRQIRIALLEADVALPVVQAFIKDVREKAVGLEKLQSVSPGQALVKLVYDELVRIMGEHNEALNLNAQPPVVVLLAGLQGSGKTTTTIKLARRLIEREHKKVMVVSCDVYRPAAIEQLQTLAEQVGAEFYPSGPSDDPSNIARDALTAAKRQMCEVLLVDTAGRLHIDAAMMAEVRNIHDVLSPHETLFVVDSMTGQDAANTAKSFNEVLELTGVILTKVDGDARGGAALSLRHITGKSIKFVGSGEKTEALEPFHPERVASRILGMGDVVTLVEEVQQKVDQDKAQKLAKKIQKGKGFNLEDFRSQLEQMQNLGGMGSLMDKLPGMSQIPAQVKSQVDDRHTTEMIAVINSMTPQERRFPDIIRGSRKRRIAGGSGTEVQVVNRLLKQHNQMKKMMKKLGRGGMKGMMRQLAGLKGGMPPGRF